MTSSSLVHLLLVEDNDVDVEAIRRALDAERIANPMTVAHDGVEALEILRGENGRERLPRPYIVLLDLSLPRLSGLEVLAELRDDSELRDSIVFVLTTSDRDEDKVASYDRNVAGYILKSEVSKDFRRLVEMLRCYWLIVALPEAATVTGDVRWPA